MAARRRYLRAALRSATLDLNAFYTCREMVDLLATQGVVPEDVTEDRLRLALQRYASRNILNAHVNKDSGVSAYLGAAWLYPIPNCYPKTREDLDREADVAAARLHEVDQPTPTKVVLEPPPGLVQPVVVHPVTQKPSWRTHVWRAAIALIALGAGLAATGWGTTQFLSYLRQGPGETIERKNKMRIRSAEDIYFLGEAYYDAGKFKLAEETVSTLLNSRSIDAATEGNGFFLLAKIQRRRGDLKMATQTAELSQRAYLSEPEVNAGRLRNVEAFIAVTHMRAGQHEKAAVLLEQLYDTETMPAYRGYLALMLSDAWFWLSDFQIAIDWNHRALALYVAAGDRNGQANAQMNEAWLLACLGQPDEADEALGKAIAMNKGLGDEDRNDYVAVTKALIDKCHGDTTDLISLSKNGDRQLDPYIAFVNEFICDPPIAEDQPPPQGGNDPPPVAVKSAPSRN